jgi:hypothetical protein
MPGGLIQLSAYGSENQYIHGNPQITFFKIVYKRHTNFSMEDIEVPLSGPDELSWDAPIKLKTKIPRNADLMHKMFLRIRMPDIISKSKYKFFWIKNFGLRIIDYIDLYIGGQLIERLTGEFEDISLQLETEGSKQDKIKRLIGSDDYANYDANFPAGYPGYNDKDSYINTDGKNIKNKFYSAAPAIFERKLFIPLHFWFTRDPGLSLPLIALQYHDIELEIQLKSIRDLYTVLEVDKTYYYYGSNKHYGSGNNMENIKHRRNGNSQGWNGIEPVNDIDIKSFNTHKRVKPGVKNKETHISQFIYGSYSDKSWSLEPMLDINYIFLDQTERKKFAESSHQYLIQQVREIKFEGNVSKTTHFLELYHPVKEIIFVTTRDDMREINEWSNTTNYKYVSGDWIYEYQNNFWFDAVKNEYTLNGRYLSDSNETISTQDDRFQELLFRYGPHGEAADSLSPLGFNIEDELYTLDNIFEFKSYWKFHSAQEIPIINIDNFKQYHTHCITNVSLKFNGNYRQQDRPPEYWNGIQSYSHHSGVPNAGIYMYSFSLYPEKFQPSGACNMSRLNNVELVIDYKTPPLKKNSEESGNAKYEWNYNTHVYAMYYNILNITSGMAGLVFGN